MAICGQGTHLSGMILQPLQPANLTDGSVGVGFSNRVTTVGVNTVVSSILHAGDVFHRNASSALSLTYVANGRLLGYTEKHMNTQDCLARQLLVAEAGGGSEAQSAEAMITQSGRFFVGAPGVFDQLIAISDHAYSA